MIFVGIDWAEAHHDVCVLDAEGGVLATRRIAEGLEGVARPHALLAEHAEVPAEVVVGIETDRGLLVGALTAAGYTVHAVNPLAASRYRERHMTSRASPTVVMPRSSPSSCAPTDSTTASWPPTASCSGLSRSSPGPTRTSCGPGSDS